MASSNTELNDRAHVKEETDHNVDMPEDPLASVATSLTELASTSVEANSRYQNVQVKQEPTQEFEDDSGAQSALEFREYNTYFSERENPESLKVKEEPNRGDETQTVQQTSNGERARAPVVSSVAARKAGKQPIVNYKPIQRKDARSRHGTKPAKSTRKVAPKPADQSARPKFCPGYNCPICMRFFKTQSKLGIHMRSHNSTNFGSKSNPTLGTSTPQICRIINLEPDHSKYKCQFCGSEFSRSSQLNIHMRSHNSKGLAINNYIPNMDLLSGAKPPAEGSATQTSDATETSTTTDALEMDETSSNDSYRSVSPNSLSQALGLEDNWTCVICAKSFNSISKLTIHQRCHNSKEILMAFRCNRCGKSFRLEEEHREHVQDCEENRRFQCEMCPKAFRRAFHLWEHKRTHTGDKPFTCMVCGKAFAEKSHLDAHTFTHGEERPHVCNICGASFTVETMLKRHMKVHASQHIIKCHDCGEIFTTESNLNDHDCNIEDQNLKNEDQNIKKEDQNVKKDESDEEPEPKKQRIEGGVHQCPVCKKKFLDARYLSIHCMTHALDEPDKCENRPVPFDNAKDIQISECTPDKIGSIQPLQSTSIDGNPDAINCNYCGQLCLTVDELDQHMVLHSGEKPGSCDVCNKTFVWSGALMYHRMMHSGNNPFSCDYCEQSFPKSPMLTRHKRRCHSEANINDCNFCFSQFRNPSDVDIHKMMFHSDGEPYPPIKEEVAYNSDEVGHPPVKVEPEYEQEPVLYNEPEITVKEEPLF